MKYILGIDPGSEKSAYIILKLLSYDSFKIEQKNWLDNEYLVKMLIRRVMEYNKLECAIETIVSYGNIIGQKTIDTSIWAGQFFRLLRDLKQDVCFLTRPNIKLNLCHNRAAKQKNIIQVIKDRFGDLGTKKNPGKLYDLKINVPKGSRDHLWSALAVVITYIDITYGELK